MLRSIDYGNIGEALLGMLLRGLQPFVNPDEGMMISLGLSTF